MEADGNRYFYDEEGNLVKKTTKEGEWNYHWNMNGMLASVQRPDGKKVSFEYDALGRRTAKTFDNKITRWVWDGNTPMHEWQYNVADRPKTVLDELGMLAKDREEPIENLITWVFDEGTFRPTAKIVEGKTYSIVNDYLGTPCEAYDEEGEKVWEAELDIYGKVRKSKGDVTFVPFRYQGQYEDKETGLYYNRFRYYSPEEGMYVSQDPIRLNGGHRLFSYVHDPNGWIDCFGLVEDPFDYLHEALKQQGNSPGDPVPASFKQKWTDSDGNKFEVRAHPADPAHGKTGSILRVGKKEPGLDAHGQGKGTFYLDSSGIWHHESTLKPTDKLGNPNPHYNAKAAADTHIQIPAGLTCK